jgi:hypothetical protein
MISPEKVQRFYAYGFNESDAHRAWSRLWAKQFKIRAMNGNFVSLNKLRNRFSFQALKRYCVYFTPANLYMSVLEWLMPERVAEKSRANRAYPVGGEYVIDVDHYLNWWPHGHHVDSDGICDGCLVNAREISLNLIDKIEENYSDIHVVFSGKKGFHIHVLDFDVRDWTHYNEADPIKSHEVARFIYTKHVKQTCGGFDDPHFILACDPMRVISFPDSLNAETGLICSYLGSREKFESVGLTEILRESRRAKWSLYPSEFEKFEADTVLRRYREEVGLRHYSHSEPFQHVKLAGR